MFNLKIENGDIKFDILGKAKLVYDNDNKIQSIIMRLQAKLGELFYNDTSYGYEPYRGKFEEKEIEEYFKDIIMQDEDISEVELISFQKNEFNSYNVVLNITLNNEEVIIIDEVIILT